MPRILMTMGALIFVVGALWWAVGRYMPGFNLGRLPGDIRVERENFSFYFPVTTSILLSLVMSLLLWLFRRQ